MTNGSRKHIQFIFAEVWITDKQLATNLCPIAPNYKRVCVKEKGRGALKPLPDLHIQSI
jgi:hypothetical protein